MNVNLATTMPPDRFAAMPTRQFAPVAADPLEPTQSSDEQPSKLRKTFDQFVGQTFYGQMMKSLRSTVGKAAYFDGGRAEEVFTAQFDQVVAEKMAQSNAHEMTGGMFKQMQTQLASLGRR